MNVLVCLKLVSQAQFVDSLGSGENRLSSGQLCVNPADMYALEMALRVKDKNPETMVTVVTMAPDQAEHALRDAIAAGADRAVLVSDRRIAGSDTLATAKVLSAAIRALPPQDLILCGKKAIDSETGHIGPQLSLLLGLPLAANVLSFRLDHSSLFIRRAGDVGLYDYSGPLPALLTVCNGTDMVRRPTILGLRRSKAAEITRFDLDDLNVPPESVGIDGSPTRTLRIEELSFRRGAGIIVNGVEAGVDRLLALAEETGKELEHE